MNENGIKHTNYRDISGHYIHSFYDLDGWKTKFGYDIHSQKTPIQIPSFVTNSITGTNKFSNGNFNSNTNGVYCLGNCTTSWNSNGKLDGGALQISSSASNNGNVGTYLGIGSVEAGKKYLIRFSLIGSKADKTLKAFFMKNGGSYDILSETKYFKLSTARSENEFLFSSATSENDVLIAFEISGQDCPFWMDNIHIYEVIVTPTNLDDYIRFEYNATSNIKTIPLEGTYIDVKNNAYSNSVTLDPYTSVILMKQFFIVLPLQFIKFTGIKVNERIDLTWTAANEVNTDYYEIEKSMNGVDFKPIGRVKASASNSFNYVYSDLNLSAGKNYYRIKQADKNGKNSYSKVISISYSKNLTLKVSPNPASDNLYIYVNAPGSGQKAILSIHSASGTIIKIIPVILSNQVIAVDISSLKSGIYVINLVAEGNVLNKEFIKL